MDVGHSADSYIHINSSLSDPAAFPITITAKNNVCFYNACYHRTHFQIGLLQSAACVCCEVL